MSKIVQRLPCGCIIGGKMCAEAERLWKSAQLAYKWCIASRYAGGANIKHTQAIFKFQDHFKVQSKEEVNNG